MTKSKKQTQETSIKLQPPKGRPMLQWFGKKSLDSIKSFPSHLAESFNPDGNSSILSNPSFPELEKDWHNLLFHGDNKEVLGFLLNNGFRGKIDLVYIDPPFDSGADYVRKIELRGTDNKVKLEGENYIATEQIQYHDIWNNDGYLQFLYERLLLLNELLSDNGFLFLHCDYHRGHLLKLLLDESFGIDNFRNEIIVKRVQKNFAEGDYIKSMNNAYDTIFLYSKNNLSKILPPRDDSAPKVDEEENWHGFDAPNWSGGRPNLNYELFGKYPPVGNVWRWTKERASQAIKDGTLKQNSNTGKPEYLVNNDKGAMVNNLWADILAYSYKENYPTEKSEKLLTRILEIASFENDIVLDCFIGSGTTAAVAQKLGRRWIGCDINKGAIQTTSKRLQEIIEDQIKQENKSKEKLFSDNSSKKYFSFANYKVNDYDLQILRTEAIELAIEHLGIVRTKKDNFFDGMLGKKLCKIIDFNHPLSLHDLQTVKDELRKRPDEDRNIIIVCLGKEIQVDVWIADYNKLHPVNKVDVIELRTDSKYGKFFTHKPCKAKVDINRKGKDAIIEIKQFLSPTILERLEIDSSLFNVKIPDFRSMIDVVLIDSNYNGEVFNIAISDVPEKKNDLVAGIYKIQISKDKTTIAVKIIDMLGEELLITKGI